jgi:predicted PurR-regulated permease PerM
VRWTFGVASVYSLIAVAMLAVIMLGGAPLIDEASQFTTELPGRYQSLRDGLSQSSHRIAREFAGMLPEDPFADRPEAAENPAAADDESSSDKTEAEGDWQPAVDFTWLAFQGILSTAVVFVLSAYWLLQEQRTWQSLLLAVPPTRRENVRTLVDSINEKVGAYVRGQFVLCLIVGAMSLFGYWLIGLPQAFLLATIAGIFEAVPMIGPLIGAIPALLVALASDPSKALGVLAVVIVIQQLENYLLVPRIMDRAVGIHGFVTLLAIAAFGTLFGVAGAVLAIPLAAIVQVIVNRYLLDAQALQPAQPPGRDRANRLRFELQTLIKDVRLTIRDKPHAVDDEADHLEDAIEALAVDIEHALGDEETAPPETNGAETCALSTC